MLRRIAEATTGAVYSASNPATINDVFTAVVSNFWTAIVSTADGDSFRDRFFTPRVAGR